MKRLSGGIDVRCESHHILILDEEDNVLYNQKVAYKLNEFTESIKLFRKIKNKKEEKSPLPWRERTAIVHHLTGYYLIRGLPSTM